VPFYEIFLSVSETQMMFFFLQRSSLAVLPSLGLGSLSAREAEGRANISTGDKVQIYRFLIKSYLHYVFYYKLDLFQFLIINSASSYYQKNVTVNLLW
jgi:cAMP phosphodiesterase